MKLCKYCQVSLKGNPTSCPLCKQETSDPSNEDIKKEAYYQIKEQDDFEAFPTVPLIYKQYTLIRVLLYISFFAYSALLLIYFIFPQSGLRASYIFLGLASLWLLVLTIVRKRRNVGKSILYLVSLLSLLLLFWDRVTSWRGWSLTYAIPMLICAALLAILIAVGYIQQELGDYILYIGAVAIIGLVPLLFIIFGWVNVLWPSIVSIALSVLMIVYLFSFRYRLITHELKKRMHL